MAASNRKQLEWLKSRITCSSCSSILDDPTTLPCLHNICSQCFQEMDEQCSGPKAAYTGPTLCGGPKSGYPCPEICDCPKNSPKSGYTCPVCKELCARKQISKNPLLTELIAIYDRMNSQKTVAPSLCKQCKSAVASVRCLECKTDLCDTCKTFHDGFELLKTHHSVSLSGDETSTQSTVLIDQFVFCQKHEKKLVELHCVPCETVICSTCKATNHDGHKCESTEDALKRILPEIRDIQSKIYYTSQGIGTKREQILQNAASVCGTIEAMEKEILDAYEEIREKINNDVADLLNKLHAMKEKIEIQEKTCVDVIDKQLNYSSRLVTWVDTITTMATGTSLLSELQSGLRKKLETVAKNLAQCQKSFDTAALIDDTSSKLIFESTPLSHDNGIGQIHERQSGLWPFSIKDLCTTQPVHITDIALQCHPNLYFSLVRGHIWIPTQVNYQGCIMVYTLDGSYYNTVKIPGIVDTPRAVVEWKSYAHARDRTVDAVVASNTGVFAISADGELLDTIHEGNFYGLCTSGDIVYALEHNTHQIYTFQYKYGTWTQLKTLPLAKLKHSKYNQLANTLQVVNDHIYVYIWGFDTVYRYNKNGVLTGQFGSEGKGGNAGRLYAGRLCGHDKTGSLLVCDRDNKRIQVLGADGKWTMTCLKHLKFAPLYAVPVSRDMFWIMDTERNMHVFKVNG